MDETEKKVLMEVTRDLKYAIQSEAEADGRDLIRQNSISALVEGLGNNKKRVIRSCKSKYNLI